MTRIIDKVIPCDYSEIFKNRLLVITGVGRSGTTILGKLLGSMSPTYLVFEPALFKYMMEFPTSNAFSGVLFEDYILPLVHGRGNQNPDDWSSQLHQMTREQINNRWLNLRRRSSALEWLKVENPLYIVKTLEQQQHLWLIRSFFPTTKFLHIIRNGFDVVRSTVARGWYTDDYCNSAMIGWSVDNSKCKIPSFIPGSYHLSWVEWDNITRSAFVWFWLNTVAQCDLTLRYELMVNNPFYIASTLASCYHLKLTDLTHKFIEQVANHTPTDNGSVDFDSIQEPVKQEFFNLNKEMGYTPN